MSWTAIDPGMKADKDRVILVWGPRFNWPITYAILEGQRLGGVMANTGATHWMAIPDPPASVDASITSGGK